MFGVFVKNPVALILAILASCPECDCFPETANITAFIAQPSMPSYAVEGQNLTLVWTYTLASTVGLARVFIVRSNGTESPIGRNFGPGVITLAQKYQVRFRAQATNIRAELSILAVQRADQATYRMKIVPSDNDEALQLNVIVIVNYPPSITVFSKNQTVTEGGNVTLNCSADGKPTPNITWTRPSDNRVVIMPLTEIRRQDAGTYRCTAGNGIGNPATEDVWIDIQYPPEVSGTGQNATVAGGVKHMFSCPVNGNPEPRIEWFNVKSSTKISSEKQLVAGESGCYTCVASNSLGTTVNITQCLTINASLTTVPPSTISPGKEVEAEVTIVQDYLHVYGNLDSSPSKKFVAWFVREMDKIYVNMPEYNWTQVKALRPGSVIVNFILHFKTNMTREKGLDNLRVAVSSNGTFGGVKAKYLADKSTTSATPASPKPAVSDRPPWTIIGALAGGIGLLAILVGVLIWWVHKQRKCRKDTEIRNSDLGRQDDEGGYSLVQGAYAQSGPPAANGTDDAAAEHQLEGATAIPTYAVVDKSKKKKKLREGPPVYAEVDKSKKKKKKIDDRNLYETLDEPKKAKIPGELLYADLGDFQNRAMSTVSISPQPLPAIKKPEAYERTDYADIAQFLKGNTTSPQNDSNEDTEWKPERPSKKKIRGKDDETQI